MRGNRTYFSPIIYAPKYIDKIKERKLIETNLFEKKNNCSHGYVSHILWAKALGVDRSVDLWMEEKHVHGNSLPINARI